MTTGGMVFLGITLAGFGSFIVGLLYASYRAGGESSQG